MVEDFFLNISQSLKAYAWRSVLNERQAAKALDFEQKFGLKQHLARLLVARNIEEDGIFDYMNPSLRAYMFDPLMLCDMDRAASRIVKAIDKREKICIYGDYDVDGACASALLLKFFDFYGLEAKIYIPDRILEGYGPNPTVIKKLIEEQGMQLIITVDCGANSLKALEVAKALHVDVIVLDHHQMSETHELAYALVNPNRLDDLSNQGHLCGTAVVFMVMVELCRRLRALNKRVPDLLGFLDLVAFATICDVVPLIGLNRAFVIQGLKIAKQGNNIGLQALIEAANIGAPLNNFHFGFILGPRINAGGRIGDQSLGAKLLAIKDVEEAKNIAQQLTSLNKERQSLETHQLQEAEENLTFTSEGEALPFIVMASENWHQGIVGLLAARLKEKYYRPTIVLSIKKDGTATGSARSIENFDIGNAIHKAAENGLLLTGGGHKMAAGLTLKEDQICALQTMLCQTYGHEITKLYQNRTLFIDGLLSAKALTVEFCRELDQFGPYGAGNPAPVFVIRDVKIASYRQVGTNHLQIIFKDQQGTEIKAIAFHEGDSTLGQVLKHKRELNFHIAGTITLNHWQGRVNPQFQLKDVALA